MKLERKREKKSIMGKEKNADYHHRHHHHLSPCDRIFNDPSFFSTDDLPQHDKALVHVWQNDRGYLFNVIRAKLTAYRARKNSGEIYNQDLNGFNNEGLLVVQDASKRKVSPFCNDCT